MTVFLRIRLGHVDFVVSVSAGAYVKMPGALAAMPVGQSTFPMRMDSAPD